MEVIIASVMGELLGQLVSFLHKKYTSQACCEQNLERLQHILLRVYTVVEEAEGRYITNSGMLVQLERLVKAMYRGYYVLDTFKYRTLKKVNLEEKVRNSSKIITKSMLSTEELHSTLKNLETVVANMNEFVILLGSCERMSRNPYDMYLYIDNFMFSRVVEKQQIINVLLQDNPPLGAPTVLPVMGGCLVGKKTLVGYVCNDNRMRSHFSSILHLRGDYVGRMDHELFLCVRSLVVIEFTSDVDDGDWIKFYSSTTRMGRGSKVIIISRPEKIARFGTVKPIRLNDLSNEEYTYLFKVLAFGSTNPEDHPQLAAIGIEIVTLLRGFLICGNVVADMLRKNLNVQLWLHILKRYKNAVNNNYSLFGEHPKALLEKGHPADITKFASPSAPPLRLLPPRSESEVCRRKIPKVTLRDLIAGSSTVLPKEKFEIVMWESRIPPFTKYVATCIEEKTAPQRKKRRGLDT